MRACMHVCAHVHVCDAGVASDTTVIHADSVPHGRACGLLPGARMLAVWLLFRGPEPRPSARLGLDTRTAVVAGRVGVGRLAFAGYELDDGLWMWALRRWLCGLWTHVGFWRLGCRGAGHCRPDASVSFSAPQSLARGRLPPCPLSASGTQCTGAKAGNAAELGCHHAVSFSSDISHHFYVG